MTASEVGIGSLVGGRYHIDGTIGVGGMGRVYVARDRMAGDDVALKVLRADVCDDALTRRRFVREAKLLHRLRSEHVVGLRDFGFHERYPFLVMDLLEGTDLGELLDVEGELPAAEAIAVARHLCAALAVVHQAGAVHRDLKPENVVIVADAATARPKLKLIDFGVATDGDSDQTITNAETMVGTAVYMAPEQIRDPHLVDGRADVWAIGVMLYEMVTGEQPFTIRRSIAQLVKDVLEGEPTPPSAMAPIGSALEAVILKCLAKDPAERYDDVGQLDEELAPLAVAGGDLPAPRHSGVMVARGSTMPAPSSRVA